jgi:hypothetical protein
MKIVKHNKSSLINSAVATNGPTKADSVLTVALSSGKTYRYIVPNEVVEGLENAPSAGRYFNETIRAYQGSEV